jgi:hypothetical protein
MRGYTDAARERHHSRPFPALSLEEISLSTGDEVHPHRGGGLIAAGIAPGAEYFF